MLTPPILAGDAITATDMPVDEGHSCPLPPKRDLRSKCPTAQHPVASSPAAEVSEKALSFHREFKSQFDNELGSVNHSET